MPFQVTAFCELPVRLTVTPSPTFSGASVRLLTTKASAEPATPIFTRKPMLSVYGSSSQEGMAMQRPNSGSRISSWLSLTVTELARKVQLSVVGACGTHEAATPMVARMPTTTASRERVRCMCVLPEPAFSHRRSCALHGAGRHRSLDRPPLGCGRFALRVPWLSKPGDQGHGTPRA